jgi:peptidyl-prolyl cis-trans isomerase C
MKKALYLILLISFFAFSITGCAQKEGSDSPVIASINKESITQDDFIREISRVPQWARDKFKGKEGKDQFLDELIKRELIYERAKKMRLDKDTEYLARVEEFKKMTLVSLTLKKEVEEKAAVDDAAVKNFFEKNADKLTIGSQLKASHILVETEEEAKDILEKINQGEDFAALAKSFSKDTNSAKKGGDLGYFSRGKMVPEFEQAVMGLKVGEVSKPVQTRFGYHIIKPTDIKKCKEADFQQSNDAIKKQLITERKKALFDSYVEKLRSESSVTKNEDALISITLPWEKAGVQAPVPMGQQEAK